MPVVGVDSKPRNIRVPEESEGEELGETWKSVFKANMGAALEIDDFDRFKESFEKAYAEQCEVHGFRRRTYVPKTQVLKEVLGPRKANRLFTSLLKELSPEIEAIDYFYTYFAVRKIKDTKVFTQDPFPKRVEMIDFVSMTESAYPHICIAEYLERTSREGTSIYSDHFSGHITNCWEEICKFDGLRLFFRGDEVNPVIAAADILLDVVNTELREKLVRENVQTILERLCDNSRSHVHYVTNLERIRPLTRTPIQTADLIAHPIVFFVKEFERQESLALRPDSPVMCAARNAAFLLDGCLKVFKPEERDIHRIIQPDVDIFVVAGEEGRRQIKILEEAGFFDLKVWKNRELIREYALEQRQRKRTVP